MLTNVKVYSDILAVTKSSSLSASSSSSSSPSSSSSFVAILDHAKASNSACLVSARDVLPKARGVFSVLDSFWHWAHCKASGFGRLLFGLSWSWEVDAAGALWLLAAHCTSFEEIASVRARRACASPELPLVVLGFSLPRGHSWGAVCSKPK